MKKSFILFFALVFFESLISGCALFPKPEPPPPLPPIEEPKPPLKVKPDQFSAFPWSELGKPNKDGNEPNTKMHTWRDGETFASIAEDEMGNSAWGNDLSKYNDLSDSGKVTSGDKIVVPNAIIGLQSQMVIKRKGERTFGSANQYHRY